MPLNLTLTNTPDGIRMRAYPIKELDALHDGELFSTKNKILGTGSDEISFNTNRRIADIHVTVKPATGAKTVTLSFSDGNVVYDIPNGTLRGAGKAHKAEGHEQVTLRVLIDRPTVEVFLNRGETYLLQTRHGRPLKRIALTTEGVVEEFRVFGMKSIWSGVAEE